MFRSPRLAPIAAGLVVGGALAFGGGPGAAAQTPDRADSPATAEISELTLPVLDLQLETASLDGNVRRVETRDEVRLRLAADVLFRFDSARLSPRAQRRLATVADELRRVEAGTVVRVEGHTDSRGTTSYNAGLSRRRAESVRAALGAELDGEGPRLVTSGRGERDPVAANTKPDGSDSPRGRARNRRVEIRIPRG